MMMYLKLGTLCALHVEMATYLGWRPLYGRSFHQGEHIYDLPFTRGIFTPGKCLTARTAHNMADSIDGNKYNTDNIAPAARASKNLT